MVVSKSVARRTERHYRSRDHNWSIFAVSMYIYQNLVGVSVAVCRLQKGTLILRSETVAYAKKYQEPDVRITIGHKNMPIKKLPISKRTTIEANSKRILQHVSMLDEREGEKQLWKRKIKERNLAAVPECEAVHSALLEISEYRAIFVNRFQTRQDRTPSFQSGEAYVVHIPGPPHTSVIDVNNGSCNAG